MDKILKILKYIAKAFFFLREREAKRLQYINVTWKVQFKNKLPVRINYEMFDVIAARTITPVQIRRSSIEFIHCF
jgi:hypothetical protein